MTDAVHNYPRTNKMYSRDFESGVSAWAAGANTTIAQSSTIALSGTYSLRMTATAAGTVSVKTSTRAANLGLYGPGYVLLAPLGLSATKSGLTASVKIEWFDAATAGNSLGSTTSSSYAISSAVGFNGQYPALYVTRATGATHAEVTVTVSGLAAGGMVYLDEPYLGDKPEILDNLLPYSASSFEIGVTDWTVTNATPSRVAEEMAVDTGEYLMSLSATASGAVTARSPAVAVTAGTEYVTTALVKSATGVPCSWSVEWYDGASALISTLTNSFTVPVSGSTPTYVVAGGTAPAGAATARVLMTATASGAGHVVKVDHVALKVLANTAGNLLTANDYTSDVGMPPWVSNGAALSWHIDTTKTNVAKTAIDTSSAGLITLELDRLVPVTVGSYYDFAADFSHSNPSGPSTLQARVIPAWYGPDGNPLAYSSNSLFEVDTAQTYRESASVGTEAKCPEGATHAKLSLEIDCRVLDRPQTLLVDEAIIRLDPVPETSIDVDDDRGVVRLSFYIEGTGWAYTVERMDQDGSASPVRTYSGDSTNIPCPDPASQVFFEDYEAPLGTEIWYRAVVRDSLGNIQYNRITDTVTSPVLPSGDYVWLKNPGLPAVNSQIILESPPQWSRSANSTAHRIVGRRNPVVVSDVRGGRSTTVSALVFDRKVNETLDKLLDSGSPALIQAMPGLGLSGNVYVTIGDVDSDYLSSSAREDGWRWIADITETDRPTGGIQGSALRTWTDVQTTYATWDDMFAAHSDWTGVLIDDPS